MINSGVILITATHPGANVNGAINKLPTNWKLHMKIQASEMALHLDTLYALSWSSTLVTKVIVWQMLFRKKPGVSSGTVPGTFLLQTFHFSQRLHLLLHQSDSFKLKPWELSLISHFSSIPTANPSAILGGLPPNYILNPPTPLHVLLFIVTASFFFSELPFLPNGP